MTQRIPFLALLLIGVVGLLIVVWDGRGSSSSPAVMRDVMIEMADGVHLATDIHLPDMSDEGVATLLIRLPYGKDDFGGAMWWADTYTPQGYAVVVQDLRGRYGSEGIFAPYAHVVEDADVTFEWIVKQRWSNGRIATVGCSALGEVQLMQAKGQNPHLRALIAEGAGGAIGTGGASHGYFGLFEGGIPNLAAAYGWFSYAGGKTPDQMQAAGVDPAQVIADLPSGTLVSQNRSDPTDYEDFLSRFEDTAYWRTLGYLTSNDAFATPVLHVNSWHDIAVRGTFEAAALMRKNATTDAARTHQHVLIGPGLHCNFDAPFYDGHVGDLPVARDRRLDYGTIYNAWLDHWLRDGPPPNLAQYTYFVIGANRWDQAETWPPDTVIPQRWYLGPGTLTPTPNPQASLAYQYDPTNPTPSIGGPICCTGGLNLRAGPLDQSPNAARSDILRFSSPPLKTGLTIVGDIRAEIAFSSDMSDTDLVAILLDLAPDGTMLAIQQAALRLRYRDGFDSPAAPLTAGSVVMANLMFGPIAYEVAQGHRLGLHLSSSSFPRLERNLNTGGPNHLATNARVALNRVHFGGPSGSVLILPVELSNHGTENRAD